MNSIIRITTSIVVMLLMGLSAACGHNPFQQTYKHIAGAFYLMRWEDGKTYYIVDESHLKDNEIGGGVLDGTALRLGWNDQYLVAKRYATFRGDQDGWMVIDLTSKKMAGPVGDSEEAKRFPDLKLMSPSEAWDSLQ
jgi:hypothetical protein